MRLIQNLWYLLPIAADDNKTPKADDGNDKGEAEKLDEAAGGLPVAEEVEVSTETNPQNPENPYDDEEEDATWFSCGLFLCTYYNDNGGSWTAQVEDEFLAQVRVLDKAVVCRTQLT